MKDHHHALSYHQVLGVPENATLEEIRAKYKQLVWHFHPDRIHDQDEKLYRERRLKEINEAYNVLKNITRRSTQNRKATHESEPKESYSQHTNHHQEHEIPQQVYSGFGQFIYYMGKRLFFSIPFHLVLMSMVFIMLFMNPSANEFGRSLLAQSNESLLEKQTTPKPDSTNNVDTTITVETTSSTQNDSSLTDSVGTNFAEQTVSSLSLLSVSADTESNHADIVNRHQWIPSSESLSSIVVTTPSDYTINARADATTKSKVLEVLAPDTQLTVIGRSPNNTWLYVLLPDGQRAWVFTEIVTDAIRDIQTLPMIHPAQMGVIAVVSEEHDLNARSAPTTKAPILKVLPAASEIVVIGRTDGDEWLHIVLSEGEEAWVFSELVAIDAKTLSTVSIEDAPSLEEVPAPEIISSGSQVIIPTTEPVSIAPASIAPASIAPESITDQRQIDIYAQSITTNEDGYATLPIFVSSDVTGLGIHSYEFAIQFDPEVLKFVAVSNEASLSTKWRYSYQLIEPGLIRVFERGQESLAGSGLLVQLIFQANPQSSQKTDLILKQFNFDGISANIIDDGYFAHTPNAKDTQGDKT